MHSHGFCVRDLDLRVWIFIALIMINACFLLDWELLQISMGLVEILALSQSGKNLKWECGVF